MWRWTASVLCCLGCAAWTEAFGQESLGALVKQSGQSEPSTAAMQSLIERLEATEARLNELEWERVRERSEAASMAEQDAAASSAAGGDADPLVLPEPIVVPQEAEEEAEEAPKEKAWYEKYKIRGYAQLRMNDVANLEDGSAPAQYFGDSSVGQDQEFFLRRARLIVQGDVSDHLSIYLQPDFASNVPGSVDANHFVQIRDWYGDVYFDKTKIHRLRIGQSKIPYGWENLQSSSNRLPLDRSDPINTAARNERDLGVFYYWTPEYAQDFFQEVLDEGLKGSGNYGVFGIGFYNGQGGSLQEQNDNTHFISRYTQPITFANGQRMEIGIQGYTGRYVVLSSPISPLGIGPLARPTGTLETGDDTGIRDQRVAGTIVYYPEPIGFQAEWNVGRGPALNDAQTAVIEQDLHGGYAMTMLRLSTDHVGEWFPFYRYQYYQGGFKSERNAPMGFVDEHELGVEWQITKYTELVTMYTMTDRTNTRAVGAAGALSYGQFVGDLLRFQFQFSY